ncbi:MAG: HK97 gp10 family phage protein [Actinobacteria bacterium]|nr:HK97 gp10 family phage protein [Actinomycetota bacterium]
MKIHAPIQSVLEAAAAAGLRTGARGVLAEARDRAPVDDGDLRKSGRVVMDDLDATVKFTAPHAAIVHEKTELNHPNGGQAKFLETAALEYSLAEVVAEAVKARLGGG